MKIQWTSHISDPDEKIRFENSVRGSKYILQRLDDILAERQKAIDIIETGVEKYKQPGWDAIQAHYNGEKASLKYVRNLLEIDNDPRNVAGQQQPRISSG